MSLLKASPPPTVSPPGNTGNFTGNFQILAQHDCFCLNLNKSLVKFCIKQDSHVTHTHILSYSTTSNNTIQHLFTTTIIIHSIQMSLQHQRTRQQSREQQPQPKTAKKVTNSSSSNNMKLSSTRNSSATWSNSNHRERTPPISIPQRLVFDSGYNSKDRQTPMLYYNFPKQIETPLHRQTPFKRRIVCVIFF